MIVECHGDLLDDDSDVLVNTTNAIGVMGKGVALAFKKKWPSIMKPYVADCVSGVLKGGVCKLYDIPETPPLFSDIKQRKWAAFCTKHSWVEASRYEWIISGLQQLESQLYYGWYNTVALPPLGCGNGGLNWDKVYNLIKYRFSDSKITANVYLP